MSRGSVFIGLWSLAAALLTFFSLLTPFLVPFRKDSVPCLTSTASQGRAPFPLLGSPGG